LVSRMADKSLTLEKSPFRPAAIAHPQNLSSLKKSRTDAEFQAAYDVVLEIVEPFSDLSREEQLEGSAVALRRMVDRWKVTYTSSVDHYNGPYDYFVAGVSSLYRLYPGCWAVPEYVGHPL